ncbi:phosphatidylinositol 4-phosphate 5-kinase-like protein 1 [Gigantopelta aegis]|uniref:phosphatidylinositol 4-phosphate 5-kinase-like protein 1 n=1 Tax=Gigantopelta aegis TaxID=1735272 RepID=UPI001B88D6BA|nr:phosphatidylinositol 4-phosphate 5-kinase-like protein 1 [Gigantopelta aegis]
MEMHDIGSGSAPPEPTDPPQRSSAWNRLQKRLKRKGVVEVDIDHHRYQMLQCMRKGIQQVLLTHPELGPRENLQTEDYQHVLEVQVITPDNTEFVFASYASSVFAAIRRAIDVKEDQYLASVAPEQLPYLEFVSNSKSGQDFFLSNDQQYLFKTDRKYCVDFFLANIGDYLHHFLTYPHSLIVKFLGLYSITMPGESKKYFLVMQSIFYPSHRLEDRFDIKGALAGRYQRPNPPGCNVVTVLKDQNFLEETIDIGSQRDWFITQLKADTEFLRGLSVQDYSLLVGRQKLHSDEMKETLPNLVKRLAKSLPNTSSPTLSPENSNITLATKESSDISPIHSKFTEMNTIPLDDDIPPMEQVDSSKNHNASLLFPHSLTNSSYLDTIMGSSNRRLLPNCKNALHIIDGPEKRYFLGIIDFFTLYEYRQIAGRMYKNVRYGCGDHSTVPPGEYADRFLKFIIERVK